MDEQAPTRRSYRSNIPSQEPTPPTADKGTQEPPTPTPTTQEKNKGEWTNITGLFKSKSGKADTVRVSEDIAAKLHSIQPGDTLSVKLNERTGRLSLSFVKGE